MTPELCQRYLEDPEAHEAHLAECADCREVFAELDVKVAHQSVRIDDLPLAPWEGARFRSWPLVAGGALAVIAVASAIFAAAGASPAVVIGEAFRTAFPSMDVVFSFLQLARGVVQSAPIVVIVLFLAVNAILIALLRRAPKGLDA